MDSGFCVLWLATQTRNIKSFTTKRRQTRRTSKMALRFPTGKNEEIPQRNKETVYDNTNGFKYRKNTKPLWRSGNVPARARKCLQKFLCRDGSSVICVELNYLTVLPRWRCHLFFVNNCSPFYLSFIHFALKPVFASRNVRCFLRLVKNDFSWIWRCPQQNAQKISAEN